MIGSLERAHLDRFRDIIASRFGLDLGEGKLDFVVGVLERRLEARGNPGPAAYLDLLGRSHQPEEMRALAAELTITETYFLRGAEHFHALAAMALPERIRARAAERRLRLLSAGCASGEEAYSLAIVLREQFPDLASWDVTILGIDVNPLMVAKARKGRYTPWALRETPAEIRDKYFRPDGSDYILDEQIRSMVSIKERNLAGVQNGSFPSEDGFDIILCRNVLMYLVPSAAQQVIARITRALAPDGYLFLGYAETLRGLSQQFHLRHTHDSFYYQKSGAGEALSPRFTEPPRPEILPSVAPDADLSWVDAVENTCRRIDRLAQSSPCRLEPSGPGLPHATELPAPGRPVGLGLAFELLRQERFREALDLLHGLPPETTADADTQLLRAVLLANGGDLEAAEGICRRLLGADDLNASAHYLMALCREHAGDAAAAMEHDRAAIYLDATFAMPHLHLGRLAKRASDSMTARGELQHAATLLLREDAPRILLFGGGFSRETLVAFSRAEFLSAGGVL
ncbi:MAG: methyltransferase domain-containing protein [Acidobacteriia bacterium]|nr:methyltransferase domain-containing protein [Terriglobia bacterium]